MLEGYRVDPAGVQGVLADATAAGQQVARAVRPLDGAIRGTGPAADGTSGADLISSALRAFDEQISDAIKVITTRLPAAAGGLSGATVAVETGDEEMAGQLHRDAVGVLSARVGNGRWAR